MLIFPCKLAGIAFDFSPREWDNDGVPMCWRHELGQAILPYGYAKGVAAMKRKTICSIALLACALVATLLFALLPSLSFGYSERVAAPVSRLLGYLTGFIPFPLFELVVLFGAAAFVLFLIIAICRAVQQNSARPFRMVFDGALLTVAILLAGYALLWTPIARGGGLDGLAEGENVYTVDALESLCVDLIYQANALSSEVTDAQGRYRLPYDTQTMLEKSVALLTETPFITAQPAAPKLARYSEWMKLFSIAGLYSPWTGETLISEKENSVTIPFTACHEAAHAAGIGREEEANFIAYLACMAGDAHFRYSGSLSALLYAMDELKTIDRAAWITMRQEMSPSVQGDFYRMNGFGDAAETIWNTIVGGVADTFLRIGGQSGVGSYGEMTGLLLKWRELSRSA